MAGREPKKKIFISAAEPSADVHCANLIKALAAKGRDMEFVGVGGEKMAAAGCTLLANPISRAAMMYKAFGQAWYFFRLIWRIGTYLKNNSVALVVVCDSPSFNFHVAKAAKKAGLKTLFYVAPQLWAWGGWRITKLRKHCDTLACILPFEADWFGQRGLDARFVGNPLFDELDGRPAPLAKDYAGYDPARARIAIMPGSRRAEIQSLWAPMQQVAMGIKKKWPSVRFVAVAVDEKTKAILEDRHISGFECECAVASVMETARAADFSIVASGSATLQVAAAGCPMVVMYQSSRILWHLFGKMLVKTRFLSLVNILADRYLVPEFMPYFVSTKPIIETCTGLLADKGKLLEMSRRLIGLVEPLLQGRASDKVAQLLLDHLAP